jgi:hypothetical protein
VPATQLPNVIMRANENLCAEPTPTGLAILNDVLVVVVLYGDGDH